MDSMNWSHPTGRAPKSVTLVCLGPSRNAYLAGLFDDDLSPAVTGTDEVWTLNRGAGVFRHDLLWIMDHIQGEADKYPNYGALLWKHDRPIITSDDCAGWPDHVRRYPFGEIQEWLRVAVNPMHGDWFHNSVAYIVVYAAFIGVKELRIFGADYHDHRSGAVENGHPNVAYWIGRMESVGMTVMMPADSGLLNANQRGWIYGYRYDPRTYPAKRKRFRDLVGLTADQAPAEPDESLALDSGERQVAPTLSGIQPDHVNRYRWAAEKVAGGVLDLGSGIGYGASVLADADGVGSVLAIDRSAESIEYGAMHYPNPKISRIVADLNAIEFIGHFEYAVAFEVIEHLPDPRPLLKKLPANRLLASVPNERVVPFSPETAPHHFRHYLRHQFGWLLEATGWRAVGWYGQIDRESLVIPFTEACRTIIVEAVRCDSSNTREASGD